MTAIEPPVRFLNFALASTGPSTHACTPSIACAVHYPRARAVGVEERRLLVLFGLDARDRTFARHLSAGRYGFEGYGAVMLRDKPIEQTRTRRMDETDRLVAAVFAATMTARLQIAKVEDFLGYYESCLEVMRRRGTADGAAAAGRTVDTFWSRRS